MRKASIAGAVVVGGLAVVGYVVAKALKQLDDIDWGDLSDIYDGCVENKSDKS